MLALKTIYKCEFTGKEFEEQEDCIVHEYEHGGKQQKFYDLTDNFIEALENKYPNIKVKRDTINRKDELDFYIRDRIVHYRFLQFEFILDGKLLSYYRTSDEVGDCRYDWNIRDNVNSFILDFEKEFIYPNMKVLENVIVFDWDDYLDKPIYNFGELDVNYLMSLLEGKRVKIEIIEQE